MEQLLILLKLINKLFRNEGLTILKYLILFQLTIVKEIFKSNYYIT
jgi:hypothetical protein